ncbi:hypothetical protein HPG69_002525 [Diceros bicornis minor]|uniref:Mediator of RNA polymerase II transcription subunit 7 n=1 Tax=Diceros bicornis minor TaxID=77932 RepID=A0A7J7FNZ4_DICBM|nr:hypothetical protein HPG69_002525 [Diceros bicornis minor]
MFNNQFQCDDLITCPLESQDMKQLHPMQFDHKKELRKLKTSVLINFLDMLDFLIRSPGNTEGEEKLEDLKLLFVPVHPFINEYRPYQHHILVNLLLDSPKRDITRSHVNGLTLQLYEL